MTKIIALFPIFLITLFIPTHINASKTISNNEINNNFKNSNLLISYGGGGGGGAGGGSGNSPKAKAKREAKKEKIKLIFKKTKLSKNLRKENL